MKHKLVLYGPGIAVMLSNLFFPPFDPLLSAMADSLGSLARPIAEIALRYFEGKTGLEFIRLRSLLLTGI